MKKCLVIELWWIGDATLMTSALQGLLADGWEITVLAKPQTRALIEADYPSIGWIELDAPWTALYGKYKLFSWPWKAIFRVLGQLRAEHFDAALSIRTDPREHFFIWLAGVRRRIGFRTSLGGWFLNESIPDRTPDAHRVEDWWKVQEKLSPSATTFFPPQLKVSPGLADRFDNLFRADPRPVLALHCGARIAVRRWPEAYYRDLISRLRQEFDFQLVLFPDLDGYGSGLHDVAEHMLKGLSLAELLAALSCATQLICNDSGPSHLADALDVPVIVLFGPGRPEKLRPFRKHNLVLIRDLCPHHPCSDYCRFPEPYCLTKLTPETIWPEVRTHLMEQGRLPQLAPALRPSPDGGRVEI